MIGDPDQIRRKARSRMLANTAVTLAERAVEKHYRRADDVKYAAIRCTGGDKYERDLAITRLLRGGCTIDAIATHMHLPIDFIRRTRARLA
jgi:hypothetical protein